MAYNAMTNRATGYTVLEADWDILTNNMDSLNYGFVPLPVSSSIPPLSGVQAAGLDIIESSGAGTAKPTLYRLLFDKDTDEGRQWIFRIPDNYGGVPVVKIIYYSTGANTSKTCAFNVQVACVSDTDTSITAKVFDTTNQSVTTVPDAAGTADVASVTLTNASNMAAGDWCCLHLWRDISNDDAANDIAIMVAVLTYKLSTS
jgi:hypothetical protein